MEKWINTLMFWERKNADKSISVNKIENHERKLRLFVVYIETEHFHKFDSTPWNIYQKVQLIIAFTFNKSI